MMKLIAFNGSPRKNWNTAMLLQKTAEGAESAGAETEIVHLYDLDFKGCTSCFACKTRDGANYGRCAMKDALTPYIEKAVEADAIVLGSPVYFGTATGEMRSFMERLLFPLLTYEEPYRSLAEKKIKTAFIYTMNVREDLFRQSHMVPLFDRNEFSMRMIFGSSETLCSFDTLQFTDYSKVVAERFDPEKKAARRREVFPDDCRKAFDLGARLVSGN